MQAAQATLALGPTAIGFLLGLFPPVCAVHGTLLCLKKRHEVYSGHGGARSPGRWFFSGAFRAGRRCSL